MKYLAAFILLFLPIVTHAQIAITEIMYDLEGSDTDREWVEIQNTSSGDIDVSLWRFAEGTTNHKIEAVQGSPVLSPGGYAVIVDKLENFKADWPQYSGIIFDSSFSLSNTGETLILRDADLKDSDTISYATDKGGAGDGRSLQLVDGIWTAGTPTPGTKNRATAPVPAPTPSVQGGTVSPPTPTPQSGNSSSSASPSVPIPEKTIRASIESETKTVVGGRTEFRGSAFGFENKPLENVRYMWNFGDGTIAEGEHVVHTYSFPGKYAVVLSTASGEFSASAQMTIEARTADVRISSVVQNGVRAFALYNGQSESLNISLWQLVEGEKAFVIPERTFILPESSVFFSEETTGVSTLVPFTLLYPNGTVAVEGMPEAESTHESAAILQTASRAEPSRNSAVEKAVIKKEIAQSSFVKVTPTKIRFAKDDPEEVSNVTAAKNGEDMSSTTQDAAFMEQDTKGKSHLWAWVTGLVVLLGGASFAAVFLRKQEVDEITLID